MNPLKNTNEIPHKGLVLIDFWAEWCLGCKTLEPQIKTLASLFPSITFFKADFEEVEPQLLTDFKIASLPTLIIVKDGVELERKVGSEQCKSLKQWFESFVE